MTKFDFFISYKWKKYSSEARELANLLQLRSLNPWIDHENLPETITDKELADYLRTAIKTCRYVIFFETTAKLVAVVNGPTRRKYSWQERELSYTDVSKIIVLYHSQGKIGYGINRNLCPYKSLDDALSQILKVIGDGDSEVFTSQNSPCGGGKVKYQTGAASSG